MSREERFIPVVRPCMGEEEVNAARRPILSGWVTQGQEVAAFEREFAAAVGATYACAVSSCTAALHLALLAVKEQPHASGRAGERIRRSGRSVGHRRIELAEAGQVDRNGLSRLEWRVPAHERAVAVGDGSGPHAVAQHRKDARRLAGHRHR